MKKPNTIKKKKAIIKYGKKLNKIKRPKRYIPKQAGDVTVSKIELLFGAFLKNIGIEAIPQFQIGYKFYDFIIKDTKVIIEFDGSYWHCDPKLYPNGPEDKTQVKAVINDKYKDKLAAANGYKLIRVWESDFKENPSEVANKIKKILKENA